MFCNNCGKENQDNAVYCVGCGTILNADSYAYNPINDTIVLNGTNDTSVLNYQETNNVQTSYMQNTPTQNNYANFEGQADYNSFAHNQNFNNFIITKEEFFTKLLSKNSKSWVKALWIICFITAALSVVWLVLGNLISIIDLVFYLVMGILLMKKNDWRLALIVTCYSGFWSVVGLVTTGTVSGIFALIAGILATKSLKKADKAYEQYKTTGLYPTELI